MLAYRGMRTYLRDAAEGLDEASEQTVLAADRQAAVRDADRALGNVAAIGQPRQRAIDDPERLRRDVEAQMETVRRSRLVLQVCLNALDAAIEEAEAGIEESAERLDLGSSIPAPAEATFVPVPINPQPGDEGGQSRVGAQPGLLA